MMVDPHPPDVTVGRPAVDRLLSLVTTLVIVGFANAFLTLLLVWKLWSVTL